MRKYIIIFILFVFIYALCSFFMKPTGSESTNPNLTSEDKINVMINDREYGHKIFEDYGLEPSFGGSNVDRLYYRTDTFTMYLHPGNNMELTFYKEEDYIGSMVLIQGNTVMMIENNTKYTDEEALEMIRDKKELLDKMYAEYIIDKYDCTYSVDCEYQSQYQKWRENA